MVHHGLLDLIYEEEMHSDALNQFIYLSKHSAGAIVSALNGPVVKGLRHHPFTVESRVRISSGSPVRLSFNKGREWFPAVPS